MAVRRSYVRGAVTVADAHAFGSPPALVGGSGMWFDNSDATYAELETFEHPDVSYVDAAIGTLDQLENLSQNVDGVKALYARVRYQSLSADMGPPQVQIRREASAPDVRLMVGAIAPTGGGSASATWVDLPLTDQTSASVGVSELLYHLANSPGEVTMQVHAPFLNTYPNRTPRTRIFEAYLVIETAGEAPPCRLFPRSDGLGVGSGRHYPPSKSQQRSGRRFGYY